MLFNILIPPPKSQKLVDWLLEGIAAVFIGQEAHRDFEGEEETKKVVHHLPWIILLGN